ncbi:MAG: nicotinate (nicotinamide) nucleotide adenylyltransferase [Cyclonatronaceae bacterium]
MLEPHNSYRLSNDALGVMGGSFDPPHLGHLGIARSFLRSDLIDRLAVIPVYVPPHKSNDLTAYDIRLKMTRAAFGGIDRITVSDVESRLGVPSYTLNTIRFLIEKNVAPDIRLCIGSDSLAEFTTWYRYKDILRNCRLVVAERPDFSRPDLPGEFSGRVTFIEHNPLDVSATEIRRMAAEGVLSSDHVPEGVLEIITSEGLYRD